MSCINPCLQVVIFGYIIASHSPILRDIGDCESSVHSHEIVSVCRQIIKYFLPSVDHIYEVVSQCSHTNCDEAVRGDWSLLNQTHMGMRLNMRQLLLANKFHSHIALSQIHERGKTYSPHDQISS